MTQTEQNKIAIEKIKEMAAEKDINLAGAKIRRTSSRFPLSVGHGDYNGTELFGFGTDRFIWLAYKPNNSQKIKLFSANFPQDGILEFTPDSIPQPKSASIADSWHRFPYGVAHILRQNGFKLGKGFDGIIYGNIPGGGMSRSASLTLNLMLTLLELNQIQIEEDFKIIDVAQAVENKYIGSPCGQLDQIMIYFAKDSMGIHYNPNEKKVHYVPLGKTAEDFRIVSMDTGTVRPGLEKSTYKIRRTECQEFLELINSAGWNITCLADVREKKLYNQILQKFNTSHPHLCRRLTYIYNAQKGFYQMLDAWKNGDIELVGRIFRQEGIGLRDIYQISGPELDTMCDIARTVEGVLGERMLGGGDKGAAGAIVRAGAADNLKKAIDIAYPRSRPYLKDKYAVHICTLVQGIKLLDETI